MCLNRNNTVAFVGAGISRSLGYRTWNDGIYGEEDRNPGLLKLSKKTIKEFKESKVSPDDLPLIVDFCKAKMSPMEYYNFLRSEFGVRREIDQTMNTVLLWQINFKHLITTNFDPTLYDSGYHFNLQETITFPHPNINLTDERALIYIHGRAFLIDGDNEPINYFLQNLVYGRESYDKAYIIKKEIEYFIYSILKDNHLVFIGFSMDDEDFKRMFDKVIQAKNAHEEDLQQRYGNDPIDRKKVFIIGEESELNQQIINPRSADSLEKKRDSLKKMGINVISYRNNDEYHKELSIILTFLKNKAPNVNYIARERIGRGDLRDASIREDLVQ